MHDADGNRLIGSSLWASRKAFDAALPVIRALAPERLPEWSARPDERVFSNAVAGWHAGARP
jgi:hypothetical protein